MTGRICIAVQIKSGDINQNKALIDEVLALNPDLIELRWDYIDHVTSITEDLIKNLLGHVQSSVPVISTLRVSTEGGNLTIDEEKRIELLRLLIEAKSSYLDLEMSTDPKQLRELINQAISNKIKIIFSHHDFNKTPTFEEGRDIIINFLKQLVTLTTMNTDKNGPFLFKTIFTANKFEDNMTSFRLCKYFSKIGEDRNIICFCMGEMGIFSRIACVRFGSYLTFGSVKEETAPAQIHVDKLREMHELIFNEKLQEQKGQ